MLQKPTSSLSGSFSCSEKSIELEGLDDLNLNEDNTDNIDNIDQIIADIQKAYLKQNIQQGQNQVQRETINEFICNFFIKNQFDKSLDAFQEEWLMLQKKNQMKCNNIGFIPDIYIQFEKLQDELQFLKQELERANIIADKMQSNVQKLIKQRDFHKLNFQKAQQEKKQFQIEIDKLKQMLQNGVGNTFLKQSQLEQSNQEEIKSIKKKILFKNSSIMSQTQKDEEQSQLKEGGKQFSHLPAVSNKVLLQNLAKTKK